MKMQTKITKRDSSVKYKIKYLISMIYIKYFHLIKINHNL